MKQRKPKKPYPEFPLFAHAGGVWAKKIRGQFVYFGPWNDPDAALEKYLAEKDHLYAGKAPPEGTHGVTLYELVGRYLDSQLNRLNIGEISQAQYNDCLCDGKRLLDALGRRRPVESLGPDDFGRLRATISKGRNATTVSGIVGRIRSIFNWGWKSRLLKQPVDYRSEFSKPSARAMRKARAERGSRIMTAEEIRTMIEATASHPALHAMTLLGINAALGNTDCAELRPENVDAETGVLKYPRPKTWAERRGILWSETTAALKVAVEQREKYAARGKLPDRFFVTRTLRPYMHVSPTGKIVDSICGQFRRRLIDQGIHRRGLGFYSLRHTFRTVADETKDFPAVDLAMGHIPSDAQGAPYAVEMGARYRDTIGDDRLQAVSNHVWAWLFGT